MMMRLSRKSGEKNGIFGGEEVRADLQAALMMDRESHHFLDFWGFLLRFPSAKPQSRDLDGP